MRYGEFSIRGIGLVYVIAFVSFGVQIPLLVGSHGVLPAAETLSFYGERLGLARGLWYLPGLGWLSTADWFLAFLWLSGAAAGIGMLCHFHARAMAAWAWLSYLSLVNLGDVFLGYQWDSLLLEVGVLAILVAKTPQRWVVWLFRFLAFRLLFSSGVAKLVSGDPTWRGLTALRYHFETQPIPNAIAWYAHQLPHAVLDSMTFLVLVLEIIVPFGLLAPPRRVRFVAVGLSIALQAAIGFTGNYAFFNLLTCLLCLWSLEEGQGKMNPWAFGWISAGGLKILALFGLVFAEPALDLLQGFRVVNSYGLFSVMTTERPEIRIEGTADGENWREYSWRWVPGPSFVAPHQPRADWQAWFAALGDFRRQGWLHGLERRLLEGDPRARALFEQDIFPDRPPVKLRVRTYQYRFTHFGEKGWWARKKIGDYGPTVSLSDFGDERH